jgi:hypothetical protein
MSRTPLPVTKATARRLWLRAQRLDDEAPFGAGPEATRAAIEHLGYVQIDTIHVIERSHHHILWTPASSGSGRPSCRRSTAQGSIPFLASQAATLRPLSAARSMRSESVSMERDSIQPAIVSRSWWKSESGVTSGQFNHQPAAAAAGEIVVSLVML